MTSFSLMPVHGRSQEIRVPEFVAFVLERLQNGGHQAFIVGGAVRDSILGRPHDDWDITTSASPSQIEQIFSDIPRYKVKHETVTLLIRDHKVEVTTFRGPNSKALRSDLSRRDFTINAMAFSPVEKVIVDPFGGQVDLGRKVIKAVGDPVERFKEDPIRLLRAVRLATELGFSLDHHTFSVMRAMARSLADAAKERIRDELIKILITRNKPSSGFYLLHRANLLAVAIPELLEGYLKRQNRYHQYTIFKHIMVTMDTVPPILLLRLTALLHDIAKPRVRTKGRAGWRFIGHEKASAEMAQNILIRLKFSSEITEKVTHLVKHHMIGYRSEWSDSALRRWIGRIGIENLDMLIEFRKADLIAHGTGHEELGLLQELKERVYKLSVREDLVLNRSDLAIDGNTVMKVLGIQSSPKVGEVLNELLDLVTEHPELNTTDKLVDILEKRFKS